MEGKTLQEIIMEELVRTERTMDPLSIVENLHADDITRDVLQCVESGDEFPVPASDEIMERRTQYFRREMPGRKVSPSDIEATRERIREIIGRWGEKKS